MSEWARSAYNFAAFIKKSCRFFRNKRVNWKISPEILRYILPRFEHKKFIPILIDPSFVKNRIVGSPSKTRNDQQKAEKGFFLLSAAIPVQGRAISFFQFVWRNTQIGYRVYESLNSMFAIQFIKIRDLLKSVGSKAVFIMDRGFGYEYFLDKCPSIGVHYVIRVRDLKTRIVLVRNKKECPIAELVSRMKEDTICYKVYYKGTIYTNLIIRKKGRHVWVLASDISDPSAVVNLYKQRMKIEETFKDWKSTGFDIEKIQIRQWDILLKIIWCVVIAHMILYLMGEIICRSKQTKFLFKKFIQDKSSMSMVQIAWKAWLFAQNDILPVLPTLKSRLIALRKASL